MSKKNTNDSVDLRIKKLEHDNEILFSKVNSITVSQACVDEKLNSIMSTLVELKSGLGELRNLPQRRWEKIIAAIISGAATLIFGILFGKYM